MHKESAVALRYDTTLPAPFVVARERGARARALLSLARRYGVPVRSAPELEERLIELEPGNVIPQELFAPVAEIFAYVLTTGRARGTGRDEKNTRR